jgi:hypothetical protein
MGLRAVRRRLVPRDERVDQKVRGSQHLDRNDTSVTTEVKALN